MNIATYFKLVWKTNRGFIIFSMIALAAMQILILNLVASFDTDAMIETIFAQLPKNIQVFLGETFFSTLTLDGAAAFGYNHPMIIALITVNAITLPVRHISRELESGTMETLLSHPITRHNFIMMLWLTGAFLLLLLTLAAFAGSLAGVYLFHELKADIIAGITAISINMWQYMMVVFTFTMMVASYKKGGGSPGNISAMVVFLFYLIFLIGQLWDKIAFMLPYNIFNYYEPQKIMLNQGHFRLDAFVLGLLTLVFLFLSLRFFNRRDIP